MVGLLKEAATSGESFHMNTEHRAEVGKDEDNHYLGIRLVLPSYKDKTAVLGLNLRKKQHLSKRKNELLYIDLLI